jgi:hypothetical protein
VRGLGETVEKETVEAPSLYRLRRDGFLSWFKALTSSVYA